MSLYSEYLRNFQILEDRGLAIHGSRGTRKKEFLAKHIAELVELQSGPKPVPLAYAHLGAELQVAPDIVRAVCGHDEALRALAALDPLESLVGDEHFVMLTSAGDDEHQAGTSPGFLTNAPESSRPDGRQYSKQRGRQQTTFLAAISPTKPPALLAAHPPDWDPRLPERGPDASSSTTIVRSGPALTCGALVEALLPALATMSRNPLQGRIVAGGLLAAKGGRAPTGVPLMSWTFESFEELRRLGVVPVLAMTAAFRRGRPRKIGSGRAHAYYEKAGTTWTLDAEATPLALPEALERFEQNVSAEIRYGTLNESPGAVVTLVSGAVWGREHHIVYGDARDPTLQRSIVTDLFAHRGHLRPSGGSVARLEEATGRTGLRDALGHGQQMRGLRAIGVLATNRRLQAPPQSS